MCRVFPPALNTVLYHTELFTNVGGLPVDLTMADSDKTWIMVLGIGISIGWTAQLLHAYAEPHIWYHREDRWVLLLCFAAYMIAWVPVWLLPFDMVGLQARKDSSKRCDELEYSWLSFIWLVVYVTNLSAGYLTYDFARSYLDAGGFTIQRKVRLALIAVVEWYGVAAIVAICVVGAIAFSTESVFEADLCVAYSLAYSFAPLPVCSPFVDSCTLAPLARVFLPHACSWGLTYSIVYALANSYAVLIFIWLLAHALIELPRRLYYLPVSEPMINTAYEFSALTVESLL